MPRIRELARALPDLPRWVEARSYLLSGDCELHGLTEEPELSLVVRDPETGFLVVVGRPTVRAIQLSTRERVPGATLIVPPENADNVAIALPDWTRQRVLLHVLRGPGQLPPPSSRARFIDPAMLRNERDVPEDLVRELEQSASGSPVAATFIDGHPVSFCYAASITESLWDISIDTLDAHRRRGHAAECVAHLVRHMRAQGRDPVWAAVEENPASWRLAQKLGFEVVDELVLFEAPPR